METHQYLLENFNSDHQHGQNNHYLEIFQKARDDFLYKKFQANMSIAFELRQISPIYDKLLDERQTLREEQAKRLGTLWLWLTVSPNDKVEFLDFKKKIESFANRKMFKEYFYVFEQRSQEKETAGMGFHAHLLLKRNISYKQNKIVSNSKNSFKNMTKVNDFNIFHFHWCPDEYLDDKMEYMTGAKTGSEKDIKQLIDVIFREKYNLDNYYTNATHSNQKQPTCIQSKAPISPTISCEN